MSGDHDLSGQSTSSTGLNGSVLNGRIANADLPGGQKAAGIGVSEGKSDVGQRGGQANSGAEVISGNGTSAPDGQSQSQPPVSAPSSYPIDPSIPQSTPSPYPPQRPLPLNTNTVPVTKGPSTPFQNGSRTYGRAGVGLGLPTSAPYVNGSIGMPGQALQAVPRGYAPPGPPSSSEPTPPNPLPTVRPNTPPTPSQPGPSLMRNQPAPNTPLSMDLQTQFFQRFEVRPPTTHGQLQMFLAQRQRLQASGVGVPGGVGQGQARGQGQAQGQVQGAVQSEHGQAAGLGQPQTQGPMTGQTADRRVGPVPQSGLEPTAPVASRVNSESNGTASMMLPDSGRSISSDIPPAAASNSSSEAKGSYSLAPGPFATLTSRPSSSSGPPPAGSTGMGNALPNGYHANIPQTVFAASPSSISSPAPELSARRLSNASNSSIASSLPLGSGHLRANMDMESIKKQMAALQQQSSRPLSGSLPGSLAPPGTGIPNGSMPLKLANVSLMSDTLGKAFPETPRTISGRQETGEEQKAQQTPGGGGESPANRPPSGTMAGSPFDGQFAGQQLALMQSQQRMRDAQQAQARLAMVARAGSGSGPGPAQAGSPSASDAMGPPIRPSPSATNGQMVNGGPPPRNSTQTYVQFLSGLSRHLAARNIPFPPGLFEHEPPNPDVPGSTPTPPGYIDVAGQKLDLTRLWMTTTQAGGHARVSHQNAWDKLAQYMGFPPHLPRDCPLPWAADSSKDAPCRTTRSSEELLREVYMTYLSSFELYYQQTRQQAIQAASNKENGGDVDGSAQQPVQRKASGAEEGPVRAVHTEVQGHSGPAHNHVGKAEPAELPVTTTTAQAAHPPPISPAGLPQGSAQFQLPPGSGNNAFNGRLPGDVSPGSDSKKRKRATKKEPAAQGRGGRPLQIPTPLPSPPVSRQDDTFRFQNHKNDHTTAPMITPMTTRPSTPPPPKRPRYRVAYTPLQREVTTYGGWDLESINRDHMAARRFIVPAVVEDLGDVDLDALGMSLRSRLGSEVSYALTALAMLSMPGEGDDKGGLALQHCGDLLDDLVDLADGAAFGEDGWEMWDASQRAIAAKGSAPLSGHQATCDISGDSYTTLLNLAEIPDADFNSSLLTGSGVLQGEELRLCRSSVRAEAALFNHRRTDVTLAAMNLLRNFSMMNDNYDHMSASPEFLKFVVRICDLRLVSSNSQRFAQGGSGAAHFTLSEVIRLRRDALDVVWNLADKLDLSILPLDTSVRLFSLVGSFVLESGLSGFIDDSADNSGPEQRPTSWLVDSALTVLSRIGVRDANRKVMRQLDPEWTMELFEAIMSLLPDTSSAMPRILRSPLLLDMQHRLAFSLYNLAFSASLDLRRRIRERAGTLNTLTRAVRAYHSVPDRNLNLAVASRRLTETIGVLNGPDELGSGGRDISFGGEAGYRVLRGGGQAGAASLEPGILAHQEEIMVDMVFARPMDVNVFRELDKAVWV